MPQTKAQYLADLIARKNADPVLSTILTSGSKASFYYNLFVVVSEFAGDFDLTFEDFISEIESIYESKQVHNDYWWQRTALAFQFGDALSIFENGNLGYSEIDESAKIIKRAAIETSGQGQVTLKVATLDTDGITPIPLSGTQSSAFDGYVNDVTPSGIVVTIISVDGDELRISVDVEVDSQVINIDDGTLLSDGVTKPVEDAIYDYLATFQGDDFGGVFYANNMMALIISAEGVINATFSLLEKKSANESTYTDILTLTGKKFGAFSGYVKIADGYNLSDNITYTSIDE